MEKSKIIFSECKTDSEEIMKENDLDKLSHYLDALNLINVNLNTRLNDFINNRQGKVGPRYKHYPVFRNLIYKKKLYAQLRGVIQKRISKVKKENKRLNIEEQKRLKLNKNLKREKRAIKPKPFEQIFIKKVELDFPDVFKVVKEYSYNKILEEKEKIGEVV